MREGIRVGLADMVANGTMSREIAATLRDAARRRRSFLVTAVPRFAGKSTLMRAMLAHAPKGAAIRTVGEDGDDVPTLLAEAQGGYIVIPEISRGPWAPGYIWGARVRRAFAALGDGVSLATALHAPDVERAFRIICRGCGVSDEDAARLELLIYLRSLGPDEREPERRVVASVHEILGVRNGQPHTRLLHRWDEARDRFE